MTHVDFLMPLGGALSGTLPNPTLVKDEAGLVIAMRVFGPRPYVAPTPAPDNATAILTAAVFLPRLP